MVKALACVDLRANLILTKVNASHRKVIPQFCIAHPYCAELYAG